MALLIAALLSFQQTDDELRAIVERFNLDIQGKVPKGGTPPWHEVTRAGPAILKHLEAAFPGSRRHVVNTCKSGGWSPESEYLLVSLMVFHFKEKALPHFLSLVSDPDPVKSRIAAAALRHYPAKEIVGPLIEFSKSRDLAADPELNFMVTGVLKEATFFNSKSLKDLEEWHAESKARTQSEWLSDAIDHPDPARANRESAVRGIKRLLDSQGRLKALLHCFIDLGWREAGFALYPETGHSLDASGKHLWDEFFMAREQAAWKAYRELPESDRQIELALHFGGDREVAADLLLRHADQAFDYLERIAPRHHHCGHAFYKSLTFVATSKNWDRVPKLVPKLNVQFPYVNQILEGTRHPSMADKMFEMVLSGEVEKFGFRNLSVVFPKRARPDMIPRILEEFPRSKGLVRDSLIGALAESGDPRGWEILKKEVFSNPIWIGRSIQMIEGFPGDDAMTELRRFLKDSPPSQALYAARVLADRGDNSGVPQLIRELELGAMKEVRLAFWWLSQIRGRWPTKDGKPVDPWPGQDAILEMKGWWEKNKTRSRVDWLLESLEEAPTSLTPWGAIENPLSIMAKDDLKDIPTYPQDEWYRKKVTERVRSWVTRTGFKFDKNTLRVRHQPKY